MKVNFLCSQRTKTYKNLQNRFFQWAPQKIVVKLGSKGARCISKNEDISVGVYPVKDVVDPTGAGDVFWRWICFWTH